ncbi:SusE domain-containing protein [Arcticibacter eurypsychrophilus]|uniref:SusE domain-containing protein n=1 Tax=Arcticibacter eurypsychrophilus TaxID=1434752 RepID=UPI00084DE5FE|nr:SusE domain-containing protein [Arcticibacter eurypsychrophilus]
MKNIFKNILGLSVLLLLLAGCRKDAAFTYLEKVEFNSTITSSSSNVVLTEQNDAESAVTVNWTAVVYPIVAPVTYHLQLDVPADTLTATPWSKAVSVEVGEDVYSKSMTVKELNDIAMALGLKVDKADLVVRVRAFVDRYVYSAPIVVAVKPYVPIPPAPVIPSLWVPGAYQGWNPAIAPTLGSVNHDNVYEGYVDLPVGQIKLTAQAGWEPMAYGDGGTDNLIEANFNGGNFNIETAGYYFLYANLNTMKYKFIPVTWGVIGAATPGGWDSDTNLTYNTETKKWTVTLDLKSADLGSFKFRANDAWALTMGQKDGKLSYSDNPMYPYDPATADYTVPTTGNYTITLDLSVPGNYTCTIKKN